MTDYYPDMFVTHFGSSLNGAIVWWDNATSSTAVTAYMYVKAYANPLVIDSSQKTYPTCTADAGLVICNALAIGATGVTTDDLYQFGLYFANSDADESPSYDGFIAFADLSITPPATGSFAD